MKQIVSVASLCMLITTPVSAELLFEPYVGVNASHHDIDGSKIFNNSQRFSVDTDTSGLGLVIGARVFQRDNFFTELEYSYEDVGETLDSSNTLAGNEGFNRFEDMHSLVINMHYGFSEASSAYLKFGIARGDFSTEGAVAPLKHDFNETGYIYGLGYRYQFSDHWAAKADYSVVDFDPGLNIDSAGSDLKVDKAESQKLTFAVTYSF